MTTYKIDCAHSEVSFKVKHLMITTITGYFHEFDAVLTNPNSDNTFDGASVKFSAQVDSVTTNNKQRDDHIKSADFFDAAQFPKISFVSDSFKAVAGKEGVYEVLGNLTIKDATNPVKLEVFYRGKVADMHENIKYGFELKGKINRKDYGLTWNAITEAGGVTVSETVELHMHIQCEIMKNEEVYAS